MAPLSHIYTLHAIGSQDGIDFLVMEYLKGETLAQRVIKGALPLDQVLKYAIEIVDALDKAHRKGIVHLDLKPGNIMLTKAGGRSSWTSDWRSYGGGARWLEIDVRERTSKRALAGSCPVPVCVSFGPWCRVCPYQKSRRLCAR